jgi:hypothetical protein
MRDFTGGLWTREDQLMPPNGAQTMTDCYGVAGGGGLRAWYKPTTMTTSGIGSVTNERIRCMFAHENQFVSQLGNDYYLITYNTVDTKCRLYRMNASAGATTWTLLNTFVGGLDPSFMTATAFNNVTDLFFVFSFGANAQGADSGMWSVAFSTGALSHVYSSAGVVANYQQRIITHVLGVIHYTDPQLFTNIATNTALIDINEGQPNIVAFGTFSPGDLLVFKEGAPIYLVQGDLFNFTLRQMNGSKPLQIGGQVIVRGPEGIIFRVGSDGIYVTPDGSQLFPLSKQIAGTTWNTTAPLAWYDHWLYSAENALVLDYDTKAWFSTSFMTAAPGYVFPLKRLGGFWMGDNATSFTLQLFTVVAGQTTGRCESYTWKSPPLRDPSGRQLRIRAVEVMARSTNGGTSTIAVTVNGNTQTQSCDPTGRGAVMVYFLQTREEQDIQITAASNAAGVEAPRIEAVRIGSQTGHLLVNVQSDR